MNDWTPYQQYEARGYSAKQTFVIIFAFVLALGIIGLLFYISYNLIKSVPQEVLQIAGTAFIFLILALILIGALTAIYVAIAYIKQPGIQGPGIIGKIEKKLGFD